jgi:hypothetical protein
MLVYLHQITSTNFLLWNCLAKWTETWWEAHMEGSVLSFLKAEWKVSDTGSAHWASSSEPSIDASYKVSIHLAKWFQRRRYLEIDQSETRIACGGHVC